VINTNDSGLGSFRQAIVAANAVPGTDTIDFNIAPGGSQTITLLSELPTIIDPAVIDGTTQPGFAGTPIIELNGSSTVNPQGLIITAGNSTVRSLVVNRFNRSNGIVLRDGGNNVVEGNYLGTDVSGTAVSGDMQSGAIVLNSSNNRIGGATAAARNVSAGSSVGIWIVTEGSVSTGNLVQGNYIGTNAQGTAALGNDFGMVINGDSSANTVTDNLISGNRVGISLEACASGNFILGIRRARPKHRTAGDAGRAAYVSGARATSWREVK
jgi:parallel beta-helix repeat protein